MLASPLESAYVVQLPSKNTQLWMHVYLTTTDRRSMHHDRRLLFFSSPSACCVGGKLGQASSWLVAYDQPRICFKRCGRLTEVIKLQDFTTLSYVSDC